jgi:FkbM family methyltransferase
MKPAPIDPPEIWNKLWDGFHGDVGWDVGANCGQTIPIMRDHFQQVYAFEPAQECWEHLDSFTGGRYSWFPIALSDTDEDIQLIALPDKIDTGQLVTAGTHGMEWDPDLPTALIRAVPAHTVDHMIEEKGIEAPDFMKIDTEGHELKILFGARQTLAIHRPDLLIEFHSPELHDSCQTLLEQYGYKIETVRHPHYRPGSPMFFAHGWFRARQ